MQHIMYADVCRYTQYIMQHTGTPWFLYQSQKKPHLQEKLHPMHIPITGLNILILGLCSTVSWEGGGYLSLGLSFFIKAQFLQTNIVWNGYYRRLIVAVVYMHSKTWWKNMVTNLERHVKFQNNFICFSMHEIIIQSLLPS